MTWIKHILCKSSQQPKIEYMLKAIHFDRENLGQLFTKKFLIVILISIPSAIIADFFNIPLAWMIGPMIATSLIALKGFQVLMPKIA